MAYIFLTVLAVFFALGWWVQKISTASLLWYLNEKGYPCPDSEDLEKGSQYAVTHFFNDLFK